MPKTPNQGSFGCQVGNFSAILEIYRISAEGEMDMGFFSDLQSDEHPLLLRIMLSLIFGLGLVLGLSLILGALVSIIGNWAYIPFSLVAIGLLVLNLKAMVRFDSALILIVPLMMISMWLNYEIYAGVVTRWPTLIINAIWVLTVYAGKKLKFPKQALYALAMVLMVLITYLSLPKFTYAQARDILAEELELTVDNLGPGMGFMPTILCLGSGRPSLFVDRGYFFDAVVAEEVATYLFDPVSGEWRESHPSRPLTSQKFEELDPTTKHWLEDLKEKGIETD